MRMLNPSLLDDLDYLKYVLECEFGLSVAEDDFCTSDSVLEFASMISCLEIVDVCGGVGLNIIIFFFLVC